MIGLPDRLDKRDVWSLAASASDLQIEWIDGVKGEDISEKARPAGWTAKQNLPHLVEAENATLGSYRAHLNAIKRYVSTVAPGGKCLARC